MICYWHKLPVHLKRIVTVKASKEWIFSPIACEYQLIDVRQKMLKIQAIKS